MSKSSDQQKILEDIIQQADDQILENNSIKKGDTSQIWIGDPPWQQQQPWVAPYTAPPTVKPWINPSPPGTAPYQPYTPPVSPVPNEADKQVEDLMRSLGQQRNVHKDGDPLTVEVRDDQLVMGPVTISFVRTLRLPEDGKTYPLPPDMGNFPVRLVEDYADKVPEEWLQHGGVFIPMWQREALWMRFSGQSWRPNALKVAMGKINALTGEEWSDRLKKQDYLLIPEQPWLDGINAGDGVTKQFVAAPLGSGQTIEGQLNEYEEHGGIQLAVYEPIAGKFTDPPLSEIERKGYWSGGSNDYRQSWDQTSFHNYGSQMIASASTRYCAGDMGIAAGGQIEQKVYQDHHGLRTWDQDNHARVFVHLVNSEIWQEITGEEAPETPVTAQSYTDEGLPWFKIYDESKPKIKISSKLAKVKTVSEQKQTEENRSDEDIKVEDAPTAADILYGHSSPKSQKPKGDDSEKSVKIPKDQIERHHLNEDDPGRELDGDW